MFKNMTKMTKCQFYMKRLPSVNNNLVLFSTDRVFQPVIFDEGEYFGRYSDSVFA
jgi:hypothetical protein